MEFVGRRVRKEFQGFGVFFGTVKSYDLATGYFEILYEDGDSEELELSEVTSLLDGQVADQSATDVLTGKSPKVGRRPKKRRRFDNPGNDSGDNSANLVIKSCLNEDFEEIQRKNEVGREGFGKTLEKKCGTGENVVIFGEWDSKPNQDGLDLNLTHPLNLSKVFQDSDEMDDSNRGLKLNEEFKNLNDMIGLKRELILNKGLDLNAEVNFDVKENSRKSGVIDLNLDANEDEDFKQGDLEGLVVDIQKKEHLFDLNLGLDDDSKNLDAGCDGLLKENICFGMDKEAHKREIGQNVEETQVVWDSANGTCKGVQFGNVEGTPAKGFPGLERGDSVFPGTFRILDADMVNDTSPFKGLSDADPSAGHGNQDNLAISSRGRNSRKRRKLLDPVNSRTETLLRRSTRRGRANFSAQDCVSSVVSDLSSDPSSSPMVSAVSEEKAIASDREESEERVLPPKLRLPASSQNLNLDDIPILDLFSVYTFLRSFSTLLFLSPFELEEFVAAVKCKAPNLLFDFIHVSLLQTLRKHLESISDESSQSASNCRLRGLNWDFLDLITWPIFMVEYLLMHGSRLQPGFDICRLKLFETNYYKQPAYVKIEILRCLCDDTIEVEAVRSELNRRTLATEPYMDFDRNLKFETSRKRKAVMDVSGGSCLAEEKVDETIDGNSDECCLCKMDGNLICCDGCPAAFHSRCVGIANSLLPEGDWYCPECVIDKDQPWMKVGRSIRGAELLGIDPYGRLYYSSCDYLLVSDLCDTESLFNCYHKNDLTVVIQTLKSSSTLYGTIVNAISKHWDISSKVGGEKSYLEFQNVTGGSHFLTKGQISTIHLPSALLASSETCVMDELVDEGKPEERSIISTYSGNVGCEVSELFNVDPVTVNYATKTENPLASSGGSAEITKAVSGIHNSPNTGPDCPNRSGGFLNNFEIPGKPVSVADCSLTSSNTEVKQGKNIRSADHRGTWSTLTTKGHMSQGRSGTSYVNYYSFARTASSVAEELMHKQPVKISEDSTKSVDEMISAQLKAISKKSTEFHWPNIHYLNVDAQKEKCGWCFSCKVPDDERDCLFIMDDTCPVSERFTSEILGFRSRKNRKGHLTDVMCHIICVEDRLHGLLLGPWLNRQYSKIWHKSVLKASDVASVKHILLMIESNLRSLALSAEWLKHVDSAATMGSAFHVVTSSLRVSSKHGIGRKQDRRSGLEPAPSPNTSSGLGLFWWRGGRLSRELFNWKSLPRSLASKAARQAGCKKIPGILYPDGSEFAKRSKCIAWRAAVETSRSVEQLALQVRELDANIKWDEIENTKLLSVVDKESRKSTRSFKKAIIRRKCSEGSVVKYLLDFGKRRFIPDIVVRYGSKLEESSSGRRKYWLEESHVPLHLLKVFEQKRIARKSNKMGSGKLQDVGTVIKKPSKKKDFSYLFSKAEKSENYQCGHCNKDVLIREAVSCQYCKRFFHKRHVKKSDGAITAECIYTCHRCQDGKYMKITKKGKSQPKKIKKATKVLRSADSKISKNTSKDKQLVESQSKRKDSVVVPLRRSARKKCLSFQGKMIGGPKKGRQTKSRKAICKKPKSGTWQKKRTGVFHTYWLNGLHLSRNPNDERGIHFRSKKLFVPSEELATIFDQPKCILCFEQEFTSSLVYVGCEICADWFHGDAFGLGDENTINLIGFKCHKCRNRTPPVCPHLNIIGSDEVQMGGSEHDAEMECTEEVGTALLNEERKSGIVTDSNQTRISDAEDEQLCISLKQKTEATHKLNEDLRTDELVVSNGPVLSEDNTIGTKGQVNMNVIVETESPLSNCDVGVADRSDHH